jgi:hypothetical protein
MPRGFKGVRQASAKIEAKRNAGGFGPQALYFTLDPGDSAELRFCEEGDDISWCWVHEVPVEGRNWGRDVPCLDQDDEDEACPGCEKELKRKFKGFINVIWKDAPVYQRDKEGKLVKVDGEKNVIDHKDQVALWTSGVRLFEELDEVDDTYRGLRSRRFIVKRKGKGLDTKYVIKPADIDSGAEPFTKVEKELEADKYDLAEFMKQPTYDDFVTIINGGNAGSYSSDNGSKSKDDAVKDAKKKNPFMRNRSS